MTTSHPDTLTYVGGPTALIELAGARLLTDPTFDPAGTEYPTSAYTLVKRIGPAVAADAVGPIDAVLLSHDHHADNLDRAGRELLARAGRVLTTRDGAARLGGGATGLAPWESVELATREGTLRVTATPARHGPAGGDRGPVVGFVLTPLAAPERAVYVTGDTVWYEGMAEVARRFTVGTVILFMGAAHVAAAGPSPLTLTAQDGLAVARAFPEAVLVPLHFEGWDHFGEGRTEIERAFRATGLDARLRWPVPGRPIPLGTA